MGSRFGKYGDCSVGSQQCTINTASNQSPTSYHNEKPTAGTSSNQNYTMCCSLITVISVMLCALIDLNDLGVVHIAGPVEINYNLVKELWLR